MTDSQKLDLILSKIEKIDSLEKDVKDLKTSIGKIDSLEKDVRDLKTSVSKIDLLEKDVRDLKTSVSKIDSLETKIDSLEKDVKDIKTTTNFLKNDIDRIYTILENEIRVNIQRVAEGHLDLSRNLHDAMKPSNEVEMLSIRVRMLESDVKDLKRKIS